MWQKYSDLVFSSRLSDWTLCYRPSDNTTSSASFLEQALIWTMDSLIRSSGVGRLNDIKQTKPCIRSNHTVSNTVEAILVQEGTERHCVYNPSMGRWKQEDQELKVIFSLRATLRLAWVVCEYLKNQNP